MAAEMALLKPISKIGYCGSTTITSARTILPQRISTIVRMSAATTTTPTTTKGTGGGKNKKGIKETLLAPRFYTTDFDEMEQLFNTEMNKNLNEAEFEALLQEFKTDYNQTHFVRNKEFKEAADEIQGPMRQIFVEFLERSCTAEFSGFLLYKELGRRLKVLILTFSFKIVRILHLFLIFFHISIHFAENEPSGRRDLFPHVQG